MFYSVKEGEIHIKIRVTTKASKNLISSVKNDELLVYVTAVPENNKANIAIIDLFSKKIGIAKSKIRVISGQKGRNKVICVSEEVNVDSLFHKA
jgi:uncharacterized protein (TIGR00251 family)